MCTYKIGRNVYENMYKKKLSLFLKRINHFYFIYTLLARYSSEASNEADIALGRSPSSYFLTLFLFLLCTILNMTTPTTIMTTPATQIITISRVLLAP